MSANPKYRSYAWFATVNAERCRLFRFERTADSVAGVEEKGALANSWPKHERGRPMALGGITGHSYATSPNYVAEQLRRFMKEVLAWLKSQCKALQIDGLVILAAPRALGELRTSDDFDTEIFDIRQGDLMHFSTAALAVHPLVRSLLKCSANDDDSSPRGRQK